MAEKHTTLCYIEKDGAYLLLHRTKKKDDINKNKWIGIGGKLEAGETPLQCAYREVQEETGIALSHLEYRAVVAFYADEEPPEYMHLFTAKTQADFSVDCAEGTLAWVPIDQIFSLPLWEGDRLFLELLPKPTPFFHMTLRYRKEKLIEAEKDGVPYQLS